MILPRSSTQSNLALSYLISHVIKLAIVASNTYYRYRRYIHNAYTKHVVSLLFVTLVQSVEMPELITNQPTPNDSKYSGLSCQRS